MFYDPANTIGVLTVIALALLGFLAIIFVTTMERKQKEKEHEMKYQNTVPSKKLPKKQQNDEIIDTLNFMLQNGIIDTKEYNTLMVKCLPYMEVKQK